MRLSIATALYAAWMAARIAVWPLATLGLVCVRMARPLQHFAAWCLDCAREWDPRLWERDQPTDLRPPP